MISRGRNIFLVIGILVISGTWNVSYAKKKTPKSPRKIVSRSVPCSNPRIGVVIPDFIIFQSNSTPVDITVLGTCLSGASFKAMPAGPNLTAALNSPIPPAGPKPFKLSYSVTFPKADLYTACADGDSSCSSGRGPIIQVVSPDTCGPTAVGEDPIVDLQSEIPLPDTTPPIAASCTLPEGFADKAIIVDGPTGRVCEADDPGNPDAGCLDQPQAKKPLYLERRDTVNIFITNKNPFRETYKFSSTDTLIKDDDIGSFLALLVPSLGGGSGKQSSGGDGGSDSAQKTADAATNTLDSLSTDLTSLDNPHLNAGTLAQIDAKGHSLALQEKQASSALENLENLQENEKGILAPGKAAAIDSFHQSVDTNLDLSLVYRSQGEAVHPGREGPPTVTKAPPLDRQHVRDEYQRYIDAIQPLKIANQKLDEAQKIIQPRKEKIKSCTNVIQQRVDNLVLNYRYFASTYNEVRNQLVSSREKRGDTYDPFFCTNLLNSATGLWELLIRENEKILDAQIDLNLRDAFAFGARPKKPKSSDQKPALNAQAGPSTKPPADQPDSSAPSNPGLTSSNCFLKALHAQVSPALSNNITALESVLVNPNSLVSSFQIGPYADPTQVDWTLTRTIIKSGITGINLADFNSAVDDCINPAAKPDNSKNKDSSAQITGPGTMLLPSAIAAGWPQAHLQDASFKSPTAHLLFPVAAGSLSNSQKSGKKSDSKSGSGKNSSKSGGGDNSSDSSSQQTPADSSGDDSSVTTRGRRVNFGKERFIVSIGAVWAHLSQQNIGTGLGIPKFDPSGNPLPAPSPSPAPTPPAITTIITQTNHSSFRISPMAFLNTRLFEWNKSNEPVYFTFGITAKSSDSGVKPEYLLGLSQSLYDRHLFMTAGVYLGQQSYLAGNLKFNQQVPSGLTGSPPINSVYGAGFSFGISWRVPGLAK